MVGMIAARDENRLFQFLLVYLLKDIFKKYLVSLTGKIIKFLRLREGLVIAEVQKQRVFIVRGHVHDFFIEKTTDLNDVETLGITLKLPKILRAKIQIKKPF